MAYPPQILVQTSSCPQYLLVPRCLAILPIQEVDFAAKTKNERVHLLRVDLLGLSSAIEDSKGRKRATHGKLWEVGSIETFQDVFVDCLKVHYLAFANAKELHQDLTPNNLMFKRTDHASDSKATGILQDWDYVVDSDDQMRHRTGTMAFMASDLLSDQSPPHLYRHDLESFFYILVWAAFNYDFDTKERLPMTHFALYHWNDAKLSACARSKTEFLSDPETKNRLFAYLPPKRQPLLPWISSVWSLFWEANISRTTNHEMPDAEADWDDETEGGFITFESFTGALGRR
ncbi:hypothetical protein D9615_003840 [Tricholomella constricta]|uniref:Fungal-type protein kinase domain-containing protein n=1 Tax=Tricholomella constricta TaxID=117010 RepID=A0A8H5HI51_9AGAR|nr:hypothetical protein D9615_003840 [Tricholomella constricta]